MKQSLLLISFLFVLFSGCSKDNAVNSNGLTFEGYAICGMRGLNDWGNGGQVEHFRFFLTVPWGVLEIDVPNARRQSSFGSYIFEELNASASFLAREARWVELKGISKGQTYVRVGSPGVEFTDYPDDYELVSYTIQTSYYDMDAYRSGDMGAVRFQLSNVLYMNK